MASKNFLMALLASILVLSAGLTTRAQEGEEGTTGRTGFQDIPEFGGPSSVGVELKDDNPPADPYFRTDRLREGLSRWFDWKERLSEEHGFSFGLNYSGLYQVADADSEVDEAAGGIFQFQGSWTLLKSDSGST
jgi:hypothetical protein